MKFTYTLFPCMLAMLLFTHSGNAQSSFWTALSSNANVYKTNTKLEVKKVYKIQTRENVSDTTVYTIDPNPNGGVKNFLRYVLIDHDEDIIRILPQVKDTIIEGEKHIIYRRDNQQQTDDPADFYYKIVDEETTPAKKYLASERLMAIPVTIPFKVRFGVYEGDDNPTFDANISYAFGYRVRVNNNPYKKRYIRYLLSFGISSQKYMPKDSVDSKTFEPSNKVALTDALGVTYEFADKLNFGVFIGQDWMFGANKNWYYQGKPWIGIGIGFKFE